MLPVQDFGLEEGLPFTAYSKGCAARQRLLDLLGPRIEDAVANRNSLSRDLLITKLMDFMSAEGLTAFGKAARTWPPPENEAERQSQLARTLMGEAVMLMFAGTDTTAYSLTAVLPLLYLHPEWLTALNEEQDRVVAQHGEKIGRKVRRTATAHGPRHADATFTPASCTGAGGAPAARVAMRRNSVSAWIHQTLQLVSDKRWTALSFGRVGGNASWPN